MRARLLLLGAALAAFGGSLLGGFHLDDYATFAGAGPRAFGWPHPLTHILDWLNYQAAGQEPIAYHAVNLLLHLGAVLLAYECLLRLLPPRAALIAAAIFAVHPLQAETVDYVSARGATVAAVLCFSAPLTWLERRRWLAVALGAAALAETAGRTTSYAYALAALRFVRLFVFPWGFTIAPDVHEPAWISIAAAVAVVAVAVWLWRAFDARSPLTWVMVALLLMAPGLPAPLPLFALAAAAGTLLIRERRGALAVAAVAILIALSIARTYVWMSDERLWREAVRSAPELVAPKIQLAKSLRAADALELLTRARQQAPFNAEIPAAIGKILIDEQQYQGAVDELNRAVAMNPRDALAFNNRGVALAALGQLPAAAADFQQALALDPQLAEARENLKRLTGK